MAEDSPLFTSVYNTLRGVVKSSITLEGKISDTKLWKPKLRAQSLVDSPPTIIIEEGEGATAPLIDAEFTHCAAVITAAFANPRMINWDYDWFSESSKDKRKSSGKYFENVQLGTITKPTTLVDRNGKIFMWYLPGLLLPPRVNDLNRVTKSLKRSLRSTMTDSDEASWRLKGFTSNGKFSPFGAGKLSLSVGKFALGHQRLEDSIHSSPEFAYEAVQNWLRFIEPVEQLLNAVLEIVHPEMYEGNRSVTASLVGQMKRPLETWPTLYPGMDLIVNRETPPHYDQGAANTFYDHLVSFGQHTGAHLVLEDIHADLEYEPGTSVLFSGSVFRHSVLKWEGERLVMAHYAKENVYDRMKEAKPVLPTQLG